MEHARSLPPESEYDALIAEMHARGLFKRTYVQYGLTALVALIGMIASVVVIVVTDTLWMVVLSAVMFGFWTMQLGMIGHDLSHGAVLRSDKVGRLLSMFMLGIFAGLSESRWFLKHNAHHEGPNHMEHDPDLAIPFVFSEKQIASRHPLFRHWVLPYQHFLFWLALPGIYLVSAVSSIVHSYKRLQIRTLIEIVLMVIHFVALGYIAFAFLPPVSAIVFIVVSIGTMGLYMSLAFAPNHKGEDILEADEQFHWTHQITLTRNLYPSWIIFYLFGGLNFQIEHHLFSSMSRYKYPAAQKLVQAYCERNSLPYHQTTWPESMKEIYRALRKVARASRVSESGQA